MNEYKNNTLTVEFIWTFTRCF